MQTCREAQGQAWSKVAAGSLCPPVPPGQTKVMLRWEPVGHAEEKPRPLGISETRAHQAAFTQVRQLQVTPQPCQTWRVAQRALGSWAGWRLLSSSRGGLGNGGRETRAPGWTPLALVSQRVGRSRGPKSAIGVSQGKRRGLASGCTSLSLLQVPNTEETWTQLWWRILFSLSELMVHPSPVAGA